MKQAHHRLSLPARGPGLHEVTREVTAWLAEQRVRDGLLTLFVRHTSASLIIQENADPDVRRDLESFFRRLVPEDSKLYRHTAEGPDDMPAHIKAAVTATSFSIPVKDGRMALGTWQGVFLWEHRTLAHRRNLTVTCNGSNR